MRVYYSSYSARLAVESEDYQVSPVLGLVQQGTRQNLYRVSRAVSPNLLAVEEEAQLALLQVEAS